MSKLYPPFWGGIETVVYDLCAAGKKFDVYAEVLCVNDSRESVEEVYEGVKVSRCSTLFRFASVYFSIEFIREWANKRNEFDIVHVHFPNPLANLALLLFKTNSKVVLHWHSDIIQQKRIKRIYHFLERWMLKRADRIVVTSPPYLEHSEDLRSFQHKVVSVPIGIDSGRIRSLAEDKSILKLSERYQDSKMVFSLGRHVYYKGFEYLIEAARLLPSDYVVVIGGKGQLTQNLERLVEKYSLQEKVKLVGVIPAEELAGYFMSCKVFCLPSVARSEAFGVVQLEAMSMGVPVVSTNITGSGVPWVNRDGLSGIVVEPQRPDLLAEALQYVVHNPDIFRSEAIREYFLKNFDRDVMAKMMSSLYVELLAS